MDRAGNLYGTAYAGGYTGGNCAGGCGVVFKLTRSHSGWLYTTLYKFTGPDGSNPAARVVIGPNGSLYGTTVYGGAANRGTVYNLSPPASACKTALCPWTETVVYSFKGGSDGQWPEYGDVIFDQAGNLYGTTPNGGDPSCFDSCGIVFKLTPSNGGWTEGILYSFQGTNDGAFPYGSVIFDNVGNLYGTAEAGGAEGSGTVYELVPSGGGWTLSTLHSFTYGEDGAEPYGGLILDQSGNLYGATEAGGSESGGEAYQLTPSNGGWIFAPLYGFNAYSGSFAKLAMDTSGNLYGTLASSETTEVFRLTPSNGGWIQTGFPGSAGGYPFGSVILDASGNVYSTASYGGTYEKGVVFEIAP